MRDEREIPVARVHDVVVGLERQHRVLLIDGAIDRALADRQQLQHELGREQRDCGRSEDRDDTE